mmetsp:Transcript_4718/g.8580  ORF Transcript_4718/g.8580 Transcript_4718/m.8580 type:complete len:223 (-) Transcript_4718:1248-1916(-)
MEHGSGFGVGGGDVGGVARLLGSVASLSKAPRRCPTAAQSDCAATEESTVAEQEKDGHDTVSVEKHRSGGLGVAVGQDAAVSPPLRSRAPVAATSRRRGTRATRADRKIRRPVVAQSAAKPGARSGRVLAVLGRRGAVLAAPDERSADAVGKPENDDENVQREQYAPLGLLRRGGGGLERHRARRGRPAQAARNPVRRYRRRRRSPVRGVEPKGREGAHCEP